MGRTKGATNKDKQLPTLAMSEEERINVLAAIILEVVSEEQANQSRVGKECQRK